MVVVWWDNLARRSAPLATGRSSHRNFAVAFADIAPRVDWLNSPNRPCRLTAWYRRAAPCRWPQPFVVHAQKRWHRPVAHRGVWLVNVEQPLQAPAESPTPGALAVAVRLYVWRQSRSALAP